MKEVPQEIQNVSSREAEYPDIRQELCSRRPYAHTHSPHRGPSEMVAAVCVGGAQARGQAGGGLNPSSATEEGVLEPQVRHL